MPISLCCSKRWGLGGCKERSAKSTEIMWLQRIHSFHDMANHFWNGSRPSHRARRWKLLVFIIGSWQSLVGRDTSVLERAGCKRRTLLDGVLGYGSKDSQRRKGVAWVGLRGRPWHWPMLAICGRIRGDNETAYRKPEAVGWLCRGSPHQLLLEKKSCYFYNRF